MEKESPKRSGRKAVLSKNIVVSIRIDEELYNRIQDIATMESMAKGKTVSTHELIRNALHFVYQDGERMRECFKRTRNQIHRKKWMARQQIY